MESAENLTIREADPADALAMARVHVASWRETYRGLMPDDLLDDPAFVSRRERFWTAALTESRYAGNRVAVAEAGGEVVGIAMAGPPEIPRAAFDSELYLIYLLRSHHGSGAGRVLLNAVLSSEERTFLWVADPNPRAQAFYLRNGFMPDGLVKEEDGVRAIRMTRPAG